MTGPALPGIPIGTRIRDPLIVLDVEVRGGDSPHTILTFGNASGRIASAPFWPSDSHKIAGVAKGTIVAVTGIVSSYRDRRQLAVESLRPLARDQVDWRTLMPSVGDVSRLWSVMDLWRARIGGPRLARTLGLFYDDPAFREQYQQCPASVAGHHALLGGLLLHTVEVACLAGQMARLHPGGADPDLVLAGVLLHDIGKVESYRWDGAFETTLPGAVIGHVTLGALMLERRVRAAARMPCTEDELLILLHLILSHHGKLEFGAPVLPMTLEAEILHQADNASARTAGMAGALQDADNFPGGVTLSPRGVWQLERRRAWRATSDWGRAPGGACHRI